MVRGCSQHPSVQTWELRPGQALPITRSQTELTQGCQGCQGCRAAGLGRTTGAARDALAQRLESVRTGIHFCIRAHVGQNRPDGRFGE